MTERTWWGVAVCATAAILAGLLFIDGTPSSRIPAGIAVIAVFVAAWFVMSPAACSTRLEIPYTTVIVLLCGAAVAVSPNLATIQVVAYPLVWTTASTLRRSVVANVALAVSVFIGFCISVGTSQQALVQTLIIEVISVAFSFALGLWITSIARLSSDRARLIDELTAAQQELAVLNRDAGVTSERERLAREIHDTIAQDLTGLVMLTQRARRETADTGLPDTQLAQTLELLETSARAALAETRALVASTAAVGLEAGVAAALERLGERFRRETGIAVTVDAVGEFDRDTEVVILRSAQEALANVRKHSDASSVSVTLTADSLTIVDDGNGFDPDVHHSGFGLAGMRDRLALVNGNLTIDTGSRGTTLIVGLPTARVAQ